MEKYNAIKTQTKKRNFYNHRAKYVLKVKFSGNQYSFVLFLVFNENQTSLDARVRLSHVSDFHNWDFGKRLLRIRMRCIKNLNLKILFN